jgi:hypothetical protein
MRIISAMAWQRLEARPVALGLCLHGAEFLRTCLLRRFNCTWMVHRLRVILHPTGSEHMHADGQGSHYCRQGLLHCLNAAGNTTRDMIFIVLIHSVDP